MKVNDIKSLGCDKIMGNNYRIEFLCEEEFRKRKRALKKYYMSAYKKLMFEYYQNFREGKFAGTLVSQIDGYDRYELKLPTDAMFSKVYGDLILHYTVYENQKIVMLNNITPDDFLTEGHQKELSTYKGVPISKSHAEKDIFKIDWLNILNINKD